MEDFWKSVQTIQAERGADYRAFSLFSATHWAELLGAAAVIFLCAVIYYRCREVTRHQILRAVFVLISFVSYSRSSWVDRGCCLCRRILRTGCSRMLSSAGKKALSFSADRSWQEKPGSAPAKWWRTEHTAS